MSWFNKNSPEVSPEEGVRVSEGTGFPQQLIKSSIRTPQFKNQLYSVS